MPRSWASPSHPPNQTETMIRELINRFVRKSGLAQPQDWLKGVFGAEETWSGVEITAEGSLASSTVAACVRLLSESVASLPLFVYRSQNGDKVKAPEHTLYWLLHTKPNAYQTSYAWRAQMMMHVLLHGNAYSVVERDDSGRVLALWPLQPNQVTVKAKNGEMFYEVRIAGQMQRFDYGDILHVKGPSLDGMTGMSIISMARQGIGLDLATMQAGARFFRNNATPPAYVTSPKAMSNKSRDNMLAYLQENFGGLKNFGKLALLDEGLEIKSVSQSMDDAQFVSSRQFSCQDVCRWFRINPHMVGDPSRLAYASSEAEFDAFLVHSLRPWLVNIESEMNAALLPDRTQFFCEFKIDAMARGDQKARYEAYEKGLAAGFLTVADVRRWENLEFIPRTDQLELPTGGSNAPTV